MNELATTSAQIEKPVLAARIVKNGTQLLEDYVLWHKCGWSDAEFGELLGISAKTVKNRYLADARKQGLIEGHYNSRPVQNSERARNRARSVENSVPEGTTETNTPPLISNEQSTEQLQAVVCEVVEDDRIESVLPRYDSEDSESDYQLALELLSECSRLIDKHIRGKSWHESKFDELHGELTVMRDGIEPSCSDYKKGSRRFRAEREAVAPGAAW